MKTKLLGRFRDEDGTEKFVYQNNRGVIELTWIKKPHKNAHVFCLPTHYYCNLGCKFCHLTSEGDERQKMLPITSRELLAILVDVWKKYIDFQPALLLSFMGVGEPFLNYRLIPEIYRGLKEKFNNGLSPKPESLNLAMATMVPSVYPFGFFARQAMENHLPLKIHFSLHSPISEARQAIIPCTKVSVENACRRLDEYRNLTAKIIPLMEEFSKYHNLADTVELHYTVIKGINDGNAELEALIKLGQKYRLPLKILKFNPTKELKNSPREEYWLKRLAEEYGAPAEKYDPPGKNIGSSCGQFTKHYYLRTSPDEYDDFLNWKAKYEVK